jgi:4-hydroxy-3-methylbut-2-enyl diphosphate reductase
MKIRLARDYGMCFGVRDALRKTHEVAAERRATVLGQLVHNPEVTGHLRTLGVGESRLEAVGEVATEDVIITAHGAADVHRRAWEAAGHRVTDTTCPLVRRAHLALGRLVAAGYAPVVIGRKGHVEVLGLTGDFPGTVVVETEADLGELPESARIGVVSQTTQPLGRVTDFVAQIRALRPGSEVRFIDTVCQPTKDRQRALEDLARECPVVVVVGGRNSNNTGELSRTAASLGAVVHQVEGPRDLDPRWFDGVDEVGVTAGTSTLDETVDAVVTRLRLIGESRALPRHGLLRLLP